MRKTQTEKFLLEIGTEEIPAGYIISALDQLEKFITNSLNEKNINWEGVNTFATPKRLVIYIEKVADKSPGRIETIMGPPVRIAFNNSNKPTKAARGFAEKFDVNIEKLKICDTMKGKYVCVKRAILDRDTVRVFFEILPEIVKNIHFPKRMKWDDSGILFARPIRWICCLFGKKVVGIKIGNVTSDRYSYISSSMKSSKFKIGDVEEYFDKLKKLNIFLNHKDRKQFLREQIEKKALKYDASSVNFQEDLLGEVNFLVQYPTVFTGDFEKKFLKLPREVLLASMSKYQRVFGLENKNCQLISKFIGVTDGKPKELNTVIKNYRLVLESRLQDSLFFFQQDTKTSLESKVASLKYIIYHDKLGTMYEKMKRMFQLSKCIAERINLDQKRLNMLQRAVFLSKADLTTYMVNEFPSLQGVVGKIYAFFDKENANIANAIYEHYLPRYSGDSLPESKIGAIISIADRIDTLVGCFGIGLSPTGSYDPYGLRRDTYAIIKVIIHHNIRLNFDSLISKSIKLLSDKIKVPEDKIKCEVIDFVKDKLYTLFLEQCKFPQIVKAVLEIDCNDIFESNHKVNVLSEIQSKKFFLKAAKVSERTKKIYKNVKYIPDEVNLDLFEHPLEKKLWEEYKKNKDRLEEMIQVFNYKEATKIYGDVFYNLIHQFFDEVMVNVKNKKLRNNRLSLCKKIHDVYNSRVAELSKLENIEVG